MKTWAWASGKLVLGSDGSGSKIFDPGRVGSIFCGLGQVGSGQPFMVWARIRKISPKNVKLFNFFPFGIQKNCFGSGRKVPGSKPGQPLIYCGSKVSSGRVGSGPISSIGWNVIRWTGIIRYNMVSSGSVRAAWRDDYPSKNTFIMWKMSIRLMTVCLMSFRLWRFAYYVRLD